MTGQVAEQRLALPTTGSDQTSDEADGDLLKFQRLHRQIPPHLDLESLRIVIAHDYLTQRGGAERVVLALLRIFPRARLITSIYDSEGTYPDFRNFKIEVSPLQQLAAFRADPRRALPLLASVWSRTTVDADVVICSSTGWSHGIKTSGTKIVYCHNPARWLYQPEEYLAGGGFLPRASLKVMAPFLRRWDRSKALTAKVYLANSRSVAHRVEAAYDRKAVVLAPPNMLESAGPRIRPNGVQPGYLLAIGRARGYKNIEVITEAMVAMPNERLVVIGSTSELPAPVAARVTTLSSVPDAQLRWLYANAKALVACSFEDFGLTPIEAYSFGTPVAVLQAGGYLDTTLPGVTGRFIKHLTPRDVAQAIHLMNHETYDRAAIIRHAGLYDLKHFESSLRTVVDEALAPKRSTAST